MASACCSVRKQEDDRYHILVHWDRSTGIALHCAGAMLCSQALHSDGQAQSSAVQALYTVDCMDPMEPIGSRWNPWISLVYRFCTCIALQALHCLTQTQYFASQALYAAEQVFCSAV